MKKRLFGRFLCLAVSLGLSLGVFLLGALASEEGAVVSYGLNVLSAMTDVAVSAPVGNEVVFSREVFERGLNLSRVDSITVRSLPSDADGELLMGSTRVAVGQRITGENLSHLVFCAALEEELESTFTFSVNDDPTPRICNVYLLRQTNYTPTVSTASRLSLSVFTYRDLSAYGTLSAYDPDGDRLVFEIVTYPQNGSLRLTDRHAGSYVYTPYAGYTGNDSFSYVARDRYGNYSAAREVELRVELLGTSVTYVDMEGSYAYNAALALTESGIMSGTQMGERYYFDPDGSVTRLEFLVMAMHAAGIKDVPVCYNTGFADDAEIPAELKGYVATAYAMKYISGSLSQGELRFLPEEEITRAQAAVILSNIVGLCDVAVTPTFADGSEIPAWASDAIYSLNAAGILPSNGGYISATAGLTREQTAAMLWAVTEYVE